MQLLYNQTSPFIRKLVVLAHESGLIDKISLVDANPWAEDDKVSSLNPLGKVPVLIIDNTTSLFDSKLIARYLLDMADNKQMLVPASSHLLQLQLEAVADGLAEATANRFLELNRRPPEKQMDYWLERYQATITRSIAWLAQQADSLEGNFTYGAIAAATAIGYVDFRYDTLNWRDSHPQLAAWFATVATRKSMQTTQPPAA